MLPPGQSAAMIGAQRLGGGIAANRRTARRERPSRVALSWTRPQFGRSWRLPSQEIGPFA